MIRPISSKTLLPALLLIIGSFGSWALVAYKPTPTPHAEAPQKPQVSVINPQPQTLQLSIHSQGVVTPVTEIDLISEVAGKVVYLHPGLVSGGVFQDHELLVKIDSSDYDYAISAAEAGIAEANRQLLSEQAQAEQAQTEWQALGEGEPSSLALRKPQVAEAQAKLKAAQADLQRARLQRSRCELRAPFTGRVDKKQVGIGQFVQIGDKLARLYASESVEIRLPITLEDLVYLDLPLQTAVANDARQPKVTFHAALAGSQHTWQGSIVRSEGKLDDASGQLFVVAQVRNPYSTQHGQLPMLAGLFVDAEIEGKPLSNLYRLPRHILNALQQVIVVDNNRRLHIRRLEVLRIEGEFAIVKGHFTEGEQLVASGIQVPVEGIEVQIVDTAIP